MDGYKNRQHAGQVLTGYLQKYANRSDTLVLGLPRGGVPVAYEIAANLRAPLDIFIVRKLGVPGHAELAMGAIATGNVQVFNDNLIEELQITENALNEVIAKEKKELQRREISYRGKKAFPDIKNKVVILVDDGIATGASIRAAIMALKQLQPSELIIAVPVGAKEVVEKMTASVDQIICPLQPTNFQAVGMWYEQFDQTDDAQVHELLAQNEMSS